MAIYKDQYGNYVKEENGKQFVVGQNDARYGRLGQEYSQQEANNKGTLSYNPNDGSYTRTVNGVGYNVLRDDPRYNPIANEYGANNGGMAATGTVNKPTGYENYQNILGGFKDAQTQAAQGQIDAAVNRLQSSIQGVDDKYDKMASELYTGKRIAERNMGQQLAAVGLGQTGVAESTALGNEQGYLNNLNANEQARQQAIQAIMSQIAQTQADGASTLADIEGNYGGQIGNAYLNLLGGDRNQWNADRDYRTGQEQLAYNRQQAEKEEQLNKLATQLGLNYLSPEGSSYYNIPQDWWNRNVLGKSNAGTSGGGSGGSRSSGGNNSLYKIGDGGGNYKSFADVKAVLDKDIVAANLPSFNYGELSGGQADHTANVKTALVTAINGLLSNGDIDRATAEQLLKAYGIS